MFGSMVELRKKYFRSCELSVTHITFDYQLQLGALTGEVRIHIL